MAKTKEQEQASLTAFYYAIEKGASLDFNDDSIDYLKTLKRDNLSLDDQLKLTFIKFILIVLRVGMKLFKTS